MVDLWWSFGGPFVVLSWTFGGPLVILWWSFLVGFDLVFPVFVAPKIVSQEPQTLKKMLSSHFFKNATSGTLSFLSNPVDPSMFLIDVY